MIAFIGDNGGALLRGKVTLYAKGLHVPLIMAHPGLNKPGQQVSSNVSGEDHAPTILGVAGITIPKEMTGIRLVPAFQNPSFEPHDYVFAVRGGHCFGLPTNTSNFDPGRTVFTKKYKLIYNTLWQLTYHPVTLHLNISG
ncbi:MAG: sulfatase/phosphatase domain-containing protein [Chryseolinea sp.]